MATGSHDMEQGGSYGHWSEVQHGNWGPGIAEGFMKGTKLGGMQPEIMHNLVGVYPEKGEMGTGRIEAAECRGQWVDPRVDSFDRLHRRSRSRGKRDISQRPWGSLSEVEKGNGRATTATHGLEKIEQIETRVGKIEQRFDELLKTTKQIAKQQNSNGKNEYENDEKSWEAPQAPKGNDTKR